MKRRHFLRGSAAGLAAAALGPRLWGQDMDVPVGKFTELRRGVGIFELRGGTIGWLATADSAVVVDTQFELQARAFREGLRTRTERSLDALFNTHHHGDHTGGNPVLRPGAALHVAHAAVPAAQRAHAEQRNRLEGQVYADTLFDETYRLELADEVVSAQWYGRAHTSGDIVVRFEKANVLHLGDLVFHYVPPVVDRFAGATIPGWQQVLEAIHADADDDTLLIFGHGHPDHGVTGTKADLLRMRDYLGDLWDYVDTARKAGQTLEQLTVPALPKHPDVFRADWPEALPNALRAVVGEWDALHGEG